MADACLIAAHDFLGGAQAFDELLQDAMAEANVRAGGDPDRAQFLLPDVVNEFIEDLGLSAERKAKQLFYMVEAQNNLRRQVDEFVVQGKNPYVAIRTVLESHLNGANSASSEALGSFYIEIDSAGLSPYLGAKENILKIIKEIAELNKAKGKRGITVDKDAQRVAEIYETHIQSARSIMLKAGLPISNLEGRIFRQVFSVDNLKNVPRASFIDDIVPRIDTYRTLGRNKVSDAEVRKYVGDYYNDVINGRIKDLEPTAFMTDAQKKTYAKKQSEHRYLHMKDPEDTLHVIEKYSSDSFPETMARAIKDVHFNKALVQSFGVNTKYSFEQLKAHTAEKFAKSDPVLSNKISTSPELLNMYKTGTNDWDVGARSHKWADLQQLTVSLTRVMTLGGAGIASVGDLGTVMVSSARIGASGMGAVGNIMKQMTAGINKLPAAERRAILAGADAQSAYIVGSFVELTTGPSKFGRMAKGSTYLANKMFQYNGLHWITKNGKTAAGINFKAQMYHLADQDWDQLNKGFRFALMRGGVTSDEWNVVRANKDLLKRNFLGHDFVDAFKIDLLPNSAFDGVVRSGSKQNQYDVARDNLRQKLLSAVSNFADEAVPTAGVRERSIMNLGTDAGTGGRFVAASMGNLLSYPIAWMTRVAGRTLESGNPVGLSGYLFATALFYGAIADFFKETNKGRVRDYNGMLNGETPPTDFLISSIMSGGFGGIFLSTAVDYGMYGRGVSDLANPAGFGIADDVLGNIHGMLADSAEGDFESAFFKAVDTVRTIAPTQFPVVGTAFDAMIYYPMMEMFEPQRLQRLERNYQERTGGEYFITPQ